MARPEYRNQGIGADALGQLLGYAYGPLGWPWVEGQIDADNTKSIPMTEKLGGIYQGRGKRDDGAEILPYRFAAPR